MKSKRAVLVKPRKFEIVYLEVNPGPGEIQLLYAGYAIGS